jgi:hypothetical protein
VEGTDFIIIPLEYMWFVPKLSNILRIIIHFLFNESLVISSSVLDLFHLSGKNNINKMHNPRKIKEDVVPPNYIFLF